MGKIVKSLPFKLLLGVVVGILLGLVANEAVMNVVVTIKQVLGQIITFCVPLIVIGFIAPSITKLGHNASRMLMVALILAYCSSVGAAFASTAAGYAIIPPLSIVSQVDGLKELPEVDGVLGTGSYYDVANAVGQVLSGKRYKRFDDINADQSEDGRILTTPEYYAYLKIAEGCDNHCAYCVIPKLRGKLRSRPMEDLIKEAEQLASDGVKELIVVAQDTSRYGLDLYGERKLAELLRRLCKIDGLVWIRVHYLYPDEMSQELIDVLANEPKIVKYLDIPIQHINDEILRKMNRRGNGEYVRQLFTKLRHEIPGLVLRTSLITGLPGEGEVEFAQLCDFLKEYKLERVGAFAFSPEEGTRAAEMEYPDTEIAKQRAEQVAEIQSRIMDDYNESCVGQVMQVLCEGFDEEQGLWYGRTYADSVEVDGHVYFDAMDTEPAEGEFVNVLITESLGPDLLGVRQKEA